MDLLFLSKRIFLGTEQGFLNGGIIVDTEGIIRKILRTAQEVNTYVYNTESEAVSLLRERERERKRGSIVLPANRRLKCSLYADALYLF